MNSHDRSTPAALADRLNSNTEGEGMTRRRKIITAGIVLALVAGLSAGIALAFFGSGSGSTSQSVDVATAATVPVNVSASTSQSGPLAPGDSATIAVTITNPGTSSIHVGNLAATYTNPSGCPAGAFTLTPDALSTVLAAGDSTTANVGVAFNDLTAQDEAPCGGAPLAVSITVG